MKNNENIESVSKDKHGKLKVKMDYSYNHAKGLNLIAATLGELSACTSNYPVVFIKNPDKEEYRLVAMFGLRPEENHYYAEENWDSTYVPLMIQREPFLIGFDDKDENSNQLVTCLNKTSPLLSETDGIAMYNDAGEETDFLKSRHRMLAELFESEKATAAFSRKVMELDLLTPVQLVLQPENGELRKVTGMYSIDERKLKELTPEQLQELHKLDMLPACYIMLGSLFQFYNLIKLRNKKMDEKLVNFRIEVGPEEQTA